MMDDDDDDDDDDDNSQYTTISGNHWKPLNVLYFGPFSPSSTRWWFDNSLVCSPRSLGKMNPF